MITWTILWSNLNKNFPFVEGLQEDFSKDFLINSLIPLEISQRVSSGVLSGINLRKLLGYPLGILQKLFWCFLLGIFLRFLHKFIFEISQECKLGMLDIYTRISPQTHPGIFLQRIFQNSSREFFFVFWKFSSDFLLNFCLNCWNTTEIFFSGIHGGNPCWQVLLEFFKLELDVLEDF